MNKNRFLSRRAQMAFVGIGLWLLLALWSLSAFWQHIDSLQTSYQLAAKCGAMAGEFALLALVLWHCFDKHIGVRRWSLILGFFLAGVILVHAGALRGMHDAEAQQIGTERRLASTLTEMSKQQAAGIEESNSKTLGRTQSQRERLAADKKAKQAQAEIATKAQEKVASEIVASADKVKETSILPRWYLDGWCYSLIFILSLLFVGIIFLLMMNTEDIDADFDGIPDKDQQPQFGFQPQPSIVQPMAIARDGMGREWTMMGDGRWEETTPGKSTPKPTVSSRDDQMVADDEQLINGKDQRSH